MASQEALVVTDIGKPISKVTRAVPTPKEGELLVKVAAASLNPIDQKNRDYGVYIKNSLPAILGADIVGMVEKLGLNVSTFKIGDRVMAQANHMGGPDHGALQQYSLIGASQAIKIPDEISFDAAATLPCNAVTSFIALFHATGLGIPPLFSPAARGFNYQSTKIAIIGAGGNCGQFALQFSKLAGIGTIIAVASVSGASKLRALGATHVIDRNLPSGEIKSEVWKIVGDNLLYVLDTANVNDHSLGISLLSNTKKGTMAHLAPGEPDEATKSEKVVGYEKKQVIGSALMFPDIVVPFWEAASGWLRSGSLKTLEYQVIEGLDSDKVNAAMDAYKVGKGKKVNVHP